MLSVTVLARFLHGPISVPVRAWRANRLTDCTDNADG
jgi:hypothetical protein